jgi:hypothetical protein
MDNYLTKRILHPGKNVLNLQNVLCNYVIFINTKLSTKV